MPSETTPRILRRSILKSPGRTAPTGANGTTIPGLDVRRAAHDAELAVAELDVGEADAVGVGVRHDVEDARRDDAVDVAARLVDRLDLEPELVQRVGDRRRRRRGELRIQGRASTHESRRAASAHQVVTSELPGESNVAVPDVLDVVDAVEELDDPVDAEAEREAGVLLGVDADRA